MKDNISRAYLKQACSFKLLTPEEEQTLAVKIENGDNDAVERLVESNLCLVMKIAHEYTGMGVDYDDLVSAGNIGLITAARRYRSGMVKFDTYAHYRIRYEMRKIISKMSGVASSSSTKYRTDRLIHEMKRELGENATAEEISKKSGFRENYVLKVLKNGFKKKVYLDDSIGDDGKRTYLDMVAEEPCKNQFLAMEIGECVSLMMKCFERLGEKEKYVLESYYGMNDKEQKSLAQLGIEFGCSRENMRIIKDKAQERLKEDLLSRL